jgi:hypothetical protein
MAKQGSMDMFLKRKNTNVEPEIETDSSNSSDSDSADINESEASSSKRLRTSFTRKYDSSYIRFGFVVTDDGFVPKPQCVICSEVLSNDAMKPSKLIRHLNTKHKDKSSKPKEFFERKREEFKNPQKFNVKVSHINTSTLRASYKVALRIAKVKEPNTIGETLVAGCIKDVCLEMLGEPAAKKVAQVPLSNNTIARRIDDLAQDMEDQLIEQIKIAEYFSLQLDESTDVGNLAILMVYVRFEYKDDLKEKYFFSASLPTNTTSSEIFKIIIKCCNTVS